MLLRAFVDELVRCGMTDACTSPGSRCAPIVLALARDGRLRCHSHVDERAAGFFALGAAKAGGRPLAVACTSGTAAAELLPAVVEAFEARVPMLVLSADRPPELRAVGAGQTIDQIKLYGDAAKWFFEVGTHDCSPARLRWMRTLACRAWALSLEGRPGVVHLNFALREPLVVDGPLGEDLSGRPGGAPFVRRAVARAGGADAAAKVLALVEGVGGPDGARGLVVAGREERERDLGSVCDELCRAFGWPLLADPLSGARRGPAAIAHYDALLRDEGFAALQSPEIVLRVGDLPPSKPLRTWLAGLEGVPQVALDPDGAWQDPDALLTESLPFAAAATLHALVELTAATPATPPAAPAEWLAGWRHADAQAAAAIAGVLDGEGVDGAVSEPWVAAELARLLPASATLFVASSMPVRDVETFWPVLDRPPRVLCNRAANGIDGTVSSALGAAAVTAVADGPLVLLIGDVALAHDIGGLVASGRLGVAVTIVLLNNEGGGIFDFLPVAASPMAREPDVYTEHVLTPTGLDFSLAAGLAGAAYERVGDRAGFRAALGRALAEPRTAVVEVGTVRSENVALHRRIWETVAGAVRAGG